MSHATSSHPSSVVPIGDTCADSPQPFEALGQRRRVRTPVLLAIGVLALAACGSASASKSASTTPATSTPASGSPTASTPGSTTANGAARGAALQAWETCLSQNGVTLPSPSTTLPGETSAAGPSSTTPGQRGPAGGRGFGAGRGITAVLDNPADATAVTACKSLQPTFGGGGFGGGANATPANRAAYQAYLSCLADNGVAVPTTIAATGSTTTAGAPPASIDRSDPNFAAANAKCQVLLPARGPNGSTTTTTPTASTAAA